MVYLQSAVPHARLWKLIPWSSSTASASFSSIFWSGGRFRPPPPLPLASEGGAKEARFKSRNARVVPTSSRCQMLYSFTSEFTCRTFSCAPFDLQSLAHQRVLDLTESDSLKLLLWSIWGSGAAEARVVTSTVCRVAHTSHHCRLSKIPSVPKRCKHQWSPCPCEVVLATIMSQTCCQNDQNAKFRFLLMCLSLFIYVYLFIRTNDSRCTMN